MRRRMLSRLVSGYQPMLDEFAEMMLGVTERELDGRQALEIVADDELIGDAHSSMQLHGLLTDEAASATDYNLRSRYGPAFFPRVI